METGMDLILILNLSIGLTVDAAGDVYTPA